MNRPSFQLETFLCGADRQGAVSRYQEGEAVFRQGDEINGVFYIVDGGCKVSIVSGRGKEAVIALPRTGDFFGEGCLSGQRHRIATVTTLTKSKILKIDKPRMMSLLHSEPVFAELFMSYLVARTVRVEDDLVDQLFNSSEKRLARILLLMANYGKEGVPQTVIPRISQETLSDMVGTTRSRISFFMNKFRKLGFIEYKGGRFEVHSSLLNVFLYGDPSISRGDEDKDFDD